MGGGDHEELQEGEPAGRVLHQAEENRTLLDAQVDQVLREGDEQVLQSDQQLVAEVRLELFEAQRDRLPGLLAVRGFVFKKAFQAVEQHLHFLLSAVDRQTVQAAQTRALQVEPERRFLFRFERVFEQQGSDVVSVRVDEGGEPLELLGLHFVAQNRDAGFLQEPV